MQLNEKQNPGPNPVPEDRGASLPLKGPELAHLAGFILIASTPFIFGLQIFQFLYDGVWRDFSAFSILTKHFATSSLTKWLTQYHSWIGLHQLLLSTLKSVHCTVVILGMGFLLLTVPTKLD